MAVTDPGASSITVAVRVRPFTIREAAQVYRNDGDTLFLGDGSLAGAPTPKLKQSGIRSVIKVVDDRCLVFDPPEDNPVQRFSRSVVPQGKKVKDQVFAFDRIFDENVSQTEVYEGTTKNLLDSVLDGYNATVFAYGATGCGKTHTITGTAQMPGIIFLTMQELFEKIGDRSDDKTTELTLSYLEIYNETIRDLLVPGGSKQGLMLREDSHQAVSVAGLTSHHPKNVQEVMDMIVRGNEYRTVSPTAANATSSRSHAVLQINVAQKERNAAVNEPHTMATLSIIDLAGSERASATKNRGERLMEGANINKSLLALGSCINALCEARGKNHVPYRNSKLTRLLKFSLGGNCKTVMIVCVSPSSAHYDETQNTLRYANRAKNIQTKVTRNVFNVNRHVKDFLVKIDEQMALINELKVQQKDSERLFAAKFQKQLDKKGALAREGMQRIRSAYENSSAERQEKVNYMKKQRGVERRIGLLSSWVAAFDAVCDSRDEGDSMPAKLATMRQTAQGVLLELESSRHHIRQKLDKTNWERAIDSALQHSISQLASETSADSGQVASLTREAELLKSNFAREALADVLDQDKSGDAGMMQVLLTAQFDILASLSETIDMSEEEAVGRAKSMIHRLLDTAFSAASHLVKPDGAKMPVERFAPTKRGTPKRKKASNIMPDAVRPVSDPTAADQSQVSSSPIKGSPRRRKAVTVKKGVAFSPVKRRSPSKRMVRWRDDDGESGTLADFANTPKRFSPVKPSAQKPVDPPRPTCLVEEEEAETAESSPSLVMPETTSFPAGKSNRFQAGFLSKAPIAPTLSLNLDADEDRTGPLRNLDLGRAANSSLPRFRVSSSPQPASQTPESSSAKTGPPRRGPGRENHGANMTSDSETSSLIDTSKLRSAIHAPKRRDRKSSIGGVVAGRRVSSTGSSSTLSSLHHRQSLAGNHQRQSLSGHHRPSLSGHHHLHHRQSMSFGGALASSTNGVSRSRRVSAELRRRSPPMSCSPPSLTVSEVSSSFTAGQARRMNLGGGSLRIAGSPVVDGHRQRPNPNLPGAGGGPFDSKTRRITIGGSAMAGAVRRPGVGNIWR